MSFKRKQNKEELVSGSTTIVSSFLTEAATKNMAEATDRVLHDSAELEKVIKQYENCELFLKQGRVLEFTEVLKFNREAAENHRSDLIAMATHFDNPHSEKDIIILKNGLEVLGVQSKSRDTIIQAIRDHADVKYHNLGRLNPVEQYKHILDLLQKRIESAPDEQIYKNAYIDVRDHLMKSLKYEDIGSDGTSRAEVEFAANYPKLAHMLYDGHAIINEIGENVLIGAGTSGAFTLVTKGMLNSVQAIKGEMDLATAVAETLSMTTSAAVRGGVVAGVSKTIGIAARSEGIQSLSEGAAPIAIANTMYSMGKAVNDYLKGDIDVVRLKEECGEASIRGVATYYCGITGQILIPVPVLGALVGSLVGYTTSALLVQSGILGVGQKSIVHMAKKRREYIESQCFQAIELMHHYKAIFAYIGERYEYQYINEVLPSLALIESAISTWDAEKAIAGLAYLNQSFAKKMKFRSFSEFDDFMINKNNKLIL